MSAEPLNREERADLLAAADGWCDGQPDAPVSRISVGHGYRRAEATVQAAEKRADKNEERAERLRAALELIDAHPWSDRHSARIFKGWARAALAADDAARGEA